MSVRILIGDCRETLKGLADGSVDSVVCDPPYHLTSIVKRFGAANAAPAKVGATGAYARASKGFMGQTWDGGDVAFQPDTWAEVLRVLKPGGHIVAFSGTRTYHRMVCAIEDAGFEIRDQLAWIYGSGFPKSHDVSKGIDKLAGAEREVVGQQKLTGTARIKGGSGYTVEGAAGNYQTAEVREYADITVPSTDEARQWQGWGTALKPAFEPICLARKPLIGTVAGNVLAHGTGAINIDGCRIETDDAIPVFDTRGGRKFEQSASQPDRRTEQTGTHTLGRWPANICHDGSDEVMAGFPDSDGSGPARQLKRGKRDDGWGMAELPGELADAGSGSAARFFYCAKTTTEERGEGNNHPTVKPVALMRWLCRLITPPGGTVLDPFLGSGSTGLAADAEQFNFIGCELSPAYAAIAERRIRDAAGLFAQVEAA